MAHRAGHSLSSAARQFEARCNAAFNLGEPAPPRAEIRGFDAGKNISPPPLRLQAESVPGRWASSVSCGSKRCVFLSLTAFHRPLDEVSQILRAG